MSYRVTQRQRDRMAAMRSAKEAKRLAGPAPDYRPELPELRRVIEITDYDFGERRYRMELHKSSRIDCYDCYIDGNLWRSRIGWSRILEMLRKSIPRVISLNSL